MRWIGREVKKFLAEAHLHLPFLLRVAFAPAELVPEVVAGVVVGAQGLEMDSDSDDSAGSDQEDSEAEQVGGLEAAAQYWDNFLALVAALQRPWDADDTDEYREERAVEAFNLGEPCHPPRAYRRQHLSLCSRAGALVSNDLIEINPSLRSWAGPSGIAVALQKCLR